MVRVSAFEISESPQRLLQNRCNQECPRLQNKLNLSLRHVKFSTTPSRRGTAQLVPAGAHSCNRRCFLLKPGQDGRRQHLGKEQLYSSGRTQAGFSRRYGDTQRVYAGQHQGTAFPERGPTRGVVRTPLFNFLTTVSNRLKHFTRVCRDVFAVRRDFVLPPVHRVLWMTVVVLVYAVLLVVVVSSIDNGWRHLLTRKRC
eukprot:jgi/Botrbrau1/3640/Bobra.0204s0031.1